MAMTPESKVKKKVREILSKRGAYHTMPVTGGFGMSGAPDILVCYKGCFVGIECKANGNRPTALQMKNLIALDEAGGYAIVVDETSIDTVTSILNHIDSVK